MYLETPHYETGRYASAGTFLSDAEYGRALDAIVKAVVDLLLQALSLSPSALSLSPLSLSLHASRPWLTCAGTTCSSSYLYPFHSLYLFSADSNPPFFLSSLHLSACLNVNSSAAGPSSPPLSPAG